MAEEFEAGVGVFLVAEGAAVAEGAFKGSAGGHQPPRADSGGARLLHERVPAA